MIVIRRLSINGGLFYFILSFFLNPPTLLAGSFSSATGFVTPSTLSFKAVKIQLIQASDGAAYDLWSGSQEMAFSRGYQPFATLAGSGSNLAITATVPAGRYIGMVMEFKDMVASVNGSKYTGSTQGSVETGSALYSVGTLASAEGSISLTAPDTGATTVTGVMSAAMLGSGSSASTRSMFPVPQCFSPDGSICSEGDVKITSATDLPSITVLMDIYNALQVDGVNMAIQFANSYPVLMVGKPGAAIHLSNSSSTETIDASLIFDSSARLLAAQLNSVGPDISRRNGFSQVKVTTTPSGIPLDPIRQMANVSSTTLLSGGSAQFPITSSEQSAGLISLTFFNRSFSDYVFFGCTNDESGSLSGYTWVGGNCSSMGTLDRYFVKRVIDPFQILSIHDGFSWSSSGPYWDYSLGQGDGYP